MRATVRLAPSKGRPVAVCVLAMMNTRANPGHDHGTRVRNPAAVSWTIPPVMKIPAIGRAARVIGMATAMAMSQPVSNAKRRAAASRSKLPAP